MNWQELTLREFVTGYFVLSVFCTLAITALAWFEKE